MAKVVFEEKQRMRQWWILLLTFGVVAFSTYALVYQLVTGTGLGTNPPPLWFMISVEVALLLMLFAIWRLELEVRMDAAGIHYKFWPFFGWRHRLWTELQSVEVRQYKPLLEYGGWGLRLGIKGWAYNIAGNQGIQLVLQDGDKLLLGTQKPEEAAAVIARFKVVRHA
jgi:hypothetical protein